MRCLGGALNPRAPRAAGMKLGNVQLDLPEGIDQDGVD